MAYFFVDGVAERLHAGLPREAVLCAWGITEAGRKVLLHLAPATKEDTASCTAFFEDLKRRGLADPLLAVTDGAPGLIRATCVVLERQRRRPEEVRLRILRRDPLLNPGPTTAAHPDLVALRRERLGVAAEPAAVAVLEDEAAQGGIEYQVPSVSDCIRR